MDGFPEGITRNFSSQFVPPGTQGGRREDEERMHAAVLRVQKWQPEYRPLPAPKL